MGAPRITRIVRGWPRMKLAFLSAAIRATIRVIRGMFS